MKLNPMPGFLPNSSCISASRCVADIFFSIRYAEASVIDAPNGIDMMANCGVYAPQALADIYSALEGHLATVLKAAMRSETTMRAADIAYILRVATTAIKASADSLPALRHVVAGMITMAVATVAAS